jgi:hypothetical protein
MTSRSRHTNVPTLGMTRLCWGRLVTQLPPPRMHPSFGTIAGVHAPAGGDKEKQPQPRWRPANWPKIPQPSGFLMFPCDHCPQDGGATRCFRRVLLSTAECNHLRHLDVQNTSTDRPVAQAAPTPRQDTTAPPAPVVVAAPPPQPTQQHPPQMQMLPPFQLPAPPIGRGRGAMLLQLLNQQRHQHPPRRCAAFSAELRTCDRTGPRTTAHSLSRRKLKIFRHEHTTTHSVDATARAGVVGRRRYNHIVRRPTASRHRLPHAYNPKNDCIYQRSVAGPQPHNTA